LVTIADAEPTFVRCRHCSGIIDVWEPDGLRIEFTDPSSGKGKLTLVDPEKALCPECLIAVTPTPAQKELSAIFAAHRHLRDEVGAPRDATMYVIHSEGNPDLSWTQGFAVTLYGLKVRHWFDGVSQPFFSLTPNDPSAPQLNFAWFAVDIAYVHAPHSALHLRWSAQDLAQPGRLELSGWDAPGLTESDLRFLVKGVEFLRHFSSASRPGRPRGQLVRSRTWYLDMMRLLASELGRRPTQHEFLAQFEIDRGVLKDNLKTYNLWPWARFVSTALGARTQRR
jgi:hypothetical protein